MSYHLNIFVFSVNRCCIRQIGSCKICDSCLSRAYRTKCISWRKLEKILKLITLQPGYKSKSFMCHTSLRTQIPSYTLCRFATTDCSGHLNQTFIIRVDDYCGSVSLCRSKIFQKRSPSGHEISCGSTRSQTQKM